MSNANPFREYSKEELKNVALQMMREADDYGQNHALDVRDFFEGLMNSLNEATSDSAAQELLASALPTNEQSIGVVAGVQSVFQAHGIQMELFNLCVIYHDVLLDRMINNREL